MKIKDIKTFYSRNLPHIQPIGATFFVTFRLKGSIPKAKLISIEKDYKNRLNLINNKSSSFDYKAHQLSNDKKIS